MPQQGVWIRYKYTKAMPKWKYWVGKKIRSPCLSGDFGYVKIQNGHALR